MSATDDGGSRWAARRGWRQGLAIGATLAFLAIVWYAAPLGDAARPETLAERASWLRDSTFGPPVAVVGFVLGGLVLVPLVGMIVASALLFGPLTGFLTSMAGGLASGALSYAIGRILWRDAVRRLAGEKLNRLSRGVAERGMLTVAGARVVPLGPYTIVNLVFGASHVGFRDFMIGTSLGLIPVTLGFTVFADRTWIVMTEGGWGNLVALAAVLVAFAAVMTRLRRRARITAPQTTE